MPVEPPRRYSGLQKTLHWTMAALIITQVAIGITMTNIGEGPLTNNLYELHKSIGITVLALALVRLAVRARRGAPPFEPMPDWQRRAANASHTALYVLFVATPLVGWIATSYCCKPVNFLWTVPMSLPVPDAPTMEAAGWIFRIHIALAIALVAVVAIHVAGALQHHFIRRDRTLLRMLPGGE
jgi:cytochrome b561